MPTPFFHCRPAVYVPSLRISDHFSRVYSRFLLLETKDPCSQEFFLNSGAGWENRDSESGNGFQKLGTKFDIDFGCLDTRFAGIYERFTEIGALWCTNPLHDVGTVTMAMKTSKHHPNRPELLEKIQVVHLVPKQCLSALQNFPIELILVTGFCGPKQGNRGRKCGARFWSFCSGGDWRTGTLTNDLPGIRDHPEIVFSLFEQFSKPI